MKKIVLFLFSFVFLFSASSVLARSVSVFSLEPRIGSSAVRQPVSFKARYFFDGGVNNISELGIWFDVTQPLVGRVNSSAHGLVRNQSGSWRYYGTRYNGGGDTCGGKYLQPRQCYRNYVWDIGGFDIGSGSWIYFNHDEEMRDTKDKTLNTIGAYRVKSVKVIDGNTMEVEWEFYFDSFFKERELDAYLAIRTGDNISLSTVNPPFWHAAGRWRVNKGGGQILFGDDFESGSFSGWRTTKNPGGQGEGRVTAFTDMHYLGRRSALLDNIAFEKDLGNNVQGKLSLWFYDDGASNNPFYLAISTLPVERWNDRGVHTIAVGFNPTYSPQNYIYRARIDNLNGENLGADLEYQMFDTKIKRTVGWHKVVFWITDVGAWAEIDDFEREIFPHNLITLKAEADRTKNKRRSPWDWEMTSFRYIRLQADRGKLVVDNVVLETLPPMPDINTSEGLQDYMLHGLNNYIDAYEQVPMWENLDKWYSNDNTKGTRYGWWFVSINNLAHALYFRCRFLDLPFDCNQANRIVSFWFEHYDRWNPTAETHAFLSSLHLASFANSGWEHMTPHLRADLYKKAMFSFYNPMPSSYDINKSHHIGDSTGEDYPWGPTAGLALASILFSDHPHSQRWLDFSRMAAMKTFSYNKDEPCSVCPGGKVGTKTIYAPGEQLKDCDQDPDRRSRYESQDCLCRGDRAILPANHDPGYYFDNHSLHPNPDYALGSLSGLTATIRYFKLLGKTPPIEYYHNIKEIWEVHRKFIDFRSNLYNGKEIYAIREKTFCDGGVNGSEDVYWPDRGPDVNQIGNPFRNGFSDWGKYPGLGLNFIESVEYALGADAINYQGFNLKERLSKNAYYKYFDTMDYPVSLPANFSETGLNCHYAAPFCNYSQYEGGIGYDVFRFNRNDTTIHLFNTFRFHSSLPLKVCEDNIFNEKVWTSGGGINWNCDSNVKKVGNTSIVINSDNPVDAELYSPLIEVTPNKEYSVSYWVKTQNLQPSDSKVYGRIIVAQYKDGVREIDDVSTDKRIDTGFSLGENVSGTTDWIKKSYTFKTTGQTKYIRLRAPLGLQGKAKGKVYFDDIVVKAKDTTSDLNNDGKVDIFDYNILISNFGKTGSPGWIPADINKDGKVDIFDYNILVGEFGILG